MNKNLQQYSSEECFRVQMDGTKVCKTCCLYGTAACGGQEILTIGKNQKGYIVNENGIAADVAVQTEQKNKRRKKKKK